MKVKESEKAGLKLSIQKTKIQSHHFMANRWGNKENSERLYFWGLQNHFQPRQHIKKQRRYFADKGPSSQGYDFSSGQWM